MTEVTEIELTGLTGSNPLAALATFGLLRVCEEIEKLRGSRLNWITRDDWIPILVAPVTLDQETLIAVLAERQRHRSLEAFQWAEDIRVQPADYRARLENFAKEASWSDRDLADYLCAFGSGSVTDSSKGLVKPTAFHMTSGQQKFLKIASEHATAVGTDTEAKFREVLFGPWQYNDDIHSLGWDPHTERMYALRHRAPTSESPQSVAAAVWLAIEALPLFPTACSRGRLQTTAFIKSKGEEAAFYWPIWTPAITLDMLRSLVASRLLSEQTEYRELVQRGIVAVFRAQRSEFGQGYAIFRPATVVFSAS